MALPTPVAGMVIRYSYLWRDEARRGQEEGVKDRPCVIVLAVETVDDRTIVLVAPVTHVAPRNPADAIEIPAATKHRLGLDAARSWIVATEVNRFVWPGPDLRPAGPDKPQTFAYGFIPGALLEKLRKQIAMRGRAAVTDRG